MSEGKILLICDNKPICEKASDALHIAGYEVDVVSDGQSGLNNFRDDFDVVLLKYKMVGCDTDEIVSQLVLREPLVIVLLIAEKEDTNDPSLFDHIRVFDSVVIPEEVDKLLFMVKAAKQIHSLNIEHKRNTLSLRERNVALEKQNSLLARRIEESASNLTHLYDNLRSTYLRTVKSLAEAIEARDHYTHSHSENVGRYANLIAEELGLSLKEKEAIRQACELHDIGKIGIDDRILTKQGPLTEEEWDQIKQHSVKGAQILEPLNFLEDVITIVRQHHERYDGLGYPDGIKGEEICLGARIISVADAYDSMTSSRIYRQEPLLKDEALEELRRNSGLQFDPKIIGAFLRVAEKI